MNVTELLSILNDKGLECRLEGDAQVSVTQVSGLLEATENQLSFFNDPKRLIELKQTKAAVVLVRQDFEQSIASVKIFVKDPYVAYAYISQALNPIVIRSGIARTATISSSAVVPKSCQIEANVVIGDDVHLGENCIVGCGSVIKTHSELGDNVTIYSNVTIEKNCQIGSYSTIEAGSVIGGQGFGFANNQGEWIRIPQIGRVIIGCNVWVGNNCSIDRGTINDTIIADNCIIDNLVHIAHNVEIGYGSAVAGQVGFAGSTKIGKHNIFAGQVGVNGHIETADNSHFGAKAGITHSIKNAGSYSGFPAVETSAWQKSTVRVKTLDKMAKRLKLLENELNQLKIHIKDLEK